MRKYSFINNTDGTCDKPIFKKNRLPTKLILSYSFPAVAKSTAGRENPCKHMATLDAFSVFFIVVVSAHLYFAALFRRESMVALVGQPSGWPVSLCTGILTPISVTTNYERENSGGDSFILHKEATAMVATPHYVCPQFTYLFLAVRRADLCVVPCRLKVTASSEPYARRALAKDFVLAFAGRLPCTTQEARP
ncbi:host cell division inhibitor Icd-like protein [Rahnella aceris]|uniref:host cell division inhibitor Icd-like protein n=1 Tax=Rahnella sp. (strain Y9602) TaxID=2703885 RepID=UPI003BA0773F